MKKREPGRNTGIRPTGGGPWWAGIGLMGGVILVVSGVGLLLLLVWAGSNAADDWALYYGAGKVVAIGCVIAGTTLLARRRERD
ncbi:hypothetical protein ABZY02_17680 [Streptomyces sp. NPDC006649]|uniref:hypothetical protein n=1 Tax=Streptomyces sp. NPDC006649 TaxID=3156896 RepID=UPI0033B9CBEE